MYASGSIDKMVQCPFNEHHTMPSSSLQRHIVKCEKNYPHDFKLVCPYNATHRIDKQKIEEHINTCPTRKTIEASYIQRLNTHGLIRAQKECNSTNVIGYNDNSEREEVALSNDNLERSRFTDRYNDSLDVESIVSTMGVGRGRMIPSYTNFLKKTTF